MSITNQIFISEMRQLKKLIQEINRAADVFEAELWSLGGLQRHVDISVEVMRLRKKAEKFNELFYDLAGGEMLSKIHYIFSRSPNANTKHIIDQICEEWIDAKLITRLEEQSIIVCRVYGNKTK